MHTNRIQELLGRNLQEVFGEGDAARRRAAIEELYTDDCVIYAPPGILVGHDALDKFAEDLRSTHPHFAYTPHGEPQALHNAGRLAWGSGPRGEKPDYTGLDVIIVRGDKIAALYVFLELNAFMIQSNVLARLNQSVQREYFFQRYLAVIPGSRNCAQ